MDALKVHQLLRGLWILCICAITSLTIYFAFPLIYPFLIAWVIAYVLNPFVRFLENKARFPRWLAVIASILTFIGALSALLTLLISQLIVQIENLSTLIGNNIDHWISSYTTFIQSDMWQNMIARINQFYADNLQNNQTFDNNIQSIGKKLAETITLLFSNLATGFFNLIASLPNLTVVIIVIFLATFFISKDWFKIKKWSRSILPERILSKMSAIWESLQKALFGYVRAQIVLISITTIFIIIGLLVLRVNYAFTIGILIGIVDLLPYLGTGAVMVPWTIYLLINGEIPLGIGIAVLYGIVLVTRQLIEPKVLATSIGLNPLATLIAMFVGLSIFGILGLIVGPVLLVVILAVHRAHIFSEIYNYIKHGSNRK